MQGRCPRPEKRHGSASHRTRCLLLLWGTFLFLGSPLHAGEQYSAPGTLSLTGDIPSKEDMEEIYGAARWPLGGLRFAPWLGVRDAAFVSGDAEATGFEEDDFTLTIGAGLRGYLRAGKTYFAVHMLPEYVWWEENEAKRRTNGRFGAGIFGYFNRLRLEVSTNRVEEQSFFSNEVQELTSSRRDLLRVAAEADLGSRFSIFGRAQFQEFRNDEENSRFSAIDRDEELLLLGVRYRTPSGLTVGLSYKDLNNDFAPGTFDRSNSGDAQQLEIAFDGNRLSYLVRAEATALEPAPGSRFREFDEVTGSLEVLAYFSRRLNFLTYARRDFYYSLRADTSHYLGDRFGARLGLEGRRMSVGVFAEFGEDSFEAISNTAAERIDDQNAFGVSVNFELRDTIGLVIRATQSEYDSNFDDFDRKITTLGFQLELGSIFRKLGIGNPSGAW